MKLRARRIALLTVAAGCLVVAGLVAFNWSVVRDHAECWWFVATRETRRIGPEATNLRDFVSARPQMVILTSWVLQCLASDSGLRVIFDAEQDLDYGRIYRWIPTTAEAVLAMLRERGFRILEQRFPSRAYVVIGVPTPDYGLPQRLRGETSMTLELQARPR